MFLNYDSLGDIYIQKFDDNTNIKLYNNDKTGNLMKLLLANKIYNLDFSVNHLIKLNHDFSDSIIEFNNNGVISILNSDKRIIELTGENIKVKSNKNAIIYLYTKIQKEKKLKQIIFPKDKSGNNLYFSITNKNNENEFIYIIKDFGFEGHYPLLNSKSWIKILVEKASSTNIYIDNPYDKLNNLFIEENEYFIIYIANAFDEDGKPYFEEDKFEIGEVEYLKTLVNNKYNFQLINMNKNSSLVLSQKNKNKFNYQINFCNRTSYSFSLSLEYSNSNISNSITRKSYNTSSAINIEKNEIMNIKLYNNNDKEEQIIFYYNFESNKKIKSNVLSSKNYISMKALNNNFLIVGFGTEYHKDIILFQYFFKKIN